MCKDSFMALVTPYLYRYTYAYMVSWTGGLCRSIVWAFLFVKFIKSLDFKSDSLSVFCVIDWISNLLTKKIMERNKIKYTHVVNTRASI